MCFSKPAAQTLGEVGNLVSIGFLAVGRLNATKALSIFGAFAVVGAVISAPPAEAQPACASDSVSRLPPPYGDADCYFLTSVYDQLYRFPAKQENGLIAQGHKACDLMAESTGEDATLDYARWFVNQDGGDSSMLSKAWLLAIFAKTAYCPSV